LKLFQDAYNNLGHFSKAIRKTKLTNLWKALHHFCFASTIVHGLMIFCRKRFEVYRRHL